MLCGALGSYASWPCFLQAVHSFLSPSLFVCLCPWRTDDSALFFKDASSVEEVHEGSQVSEQAPHLGLSRTNDDAAESGEEFQVGTGSSFWTKCDDQSVIAVLQASMIL